MFQKHHQIQKNSLKPPETQRKVIALAGNPNVGKSTIFNALTGMHQHTGNWPGKTVGSAKGSFTIDGESYTLVDIPGTYSLIPHSAEEEIARDFLCFENPDAIVIVCDATCLERNLNLVLQTLEISRRVIVCVNMMDEADRRHLGLDCSLLSRLLGVPVVPTCAGRSKGLNTLKKEIQNITVNDTTPIPPLYRPEIEKALAPLEAAIRPFCKNINSRWAALKLLDIETAPLDAMNQCAGCDITKEPDVSSAMAESRAYLHEQGYDIHRLRDALVSDVYQSAEAIKKQVITAQADTESPQLKADRFLTSKLTGIPVMLLLLLVVLWLTITGANYPSALLSSFLFGLEDNLALICRELGFPLWLESALVSGVYRVLAWVVSVMLPPMAIFFPLFTLLEDSGYLPRVAFNLDGIFKKCHACGKQALTMCMGFGCNAVGVTGCRIIDSPRERLIAILTNSFVPCNGRFPTLISIITMFFVANAAGILSSVSSAVLLTVLITGSVLMTFCISKLLSRTLLKGVPSSFVLELPPYRPPRVFKVIVRSIFDRTLFVLGRAVSVAAPAGLLIYILANVSVGDSSLLAHCADFLDPFAKCLGLDGVLLMAFILGFPANEIVIPIAVMAYLSESTVTDFSNLLLLKEVLVENGWTWVTAVCTMIFSLFHWPCSTTMLTVKKETGSWRYTAVAFLLPTVTGMLLCFLLNTAVHFLC